ncbi:MAG: hypothetical protein QM723_14635 [Myxococcaceae bacterium]
MPTALKVFFFSLLFGVGGFYVSFRVAVFIALKMIEGEHAELYAHAIGLLAGALVGICSAITAGVMAGRATKI